MAKSELSEVPGSPGNGSFEPLVRLAIPNKGRIAGPILDLMEKSGLHLLDQGDRRLISRTPDPHIEVLFARPIDIPEYVANGAADLGITGRDMVREREVDVEELLDLRTGKATLVLAVRDESPIRAPGELTGAKIATEFPRIAARYFSGLNIPVIIVPVGGACEVTPHLGIADAILDLTSSGETLRSNRLRVVAEVLTTSTILIANRNAYRNKREKADEIVLALESVLRARGQCYLMMNAQRSCLDEIRNLLPGLSGPTVMDVASREDLVAVHAVVGEERVYGLINRLKRAGARDILVISIERIIP
ncbi:MAG TPA: ATP phosphoribosyltransferase [Methanoregulaceae archaeon]|nr:MAG: ATP phosphoribosyltransferase [Methanolinea sp.]HON81419.1 ATP phosphoribosyltransferase [Methanoregulaceae archaeon]HPD10053.1 ATP phosphoribosyltransferase [Methanoregulaceae archaeon]HRT15059.1 ATP phosphoribosyltransferase [Methanoregulaceae archaeon]HRU30630.1 ATP phosphoribosyltransferase [Methanoregulaceae archaeon]